MKSKTVVLFEKGKTPRIFKNPESLSKLQERGTILVNPSFPKGVPPHNWRLVNGKIHTGGKIGSPFKRNKINDGDNSKFFRPAVLFLLILLISIHVYEEREVIKTIPAQIKALF